MQIPAKDIHGKCNETRALRERIAHAMQESGCITAVVLGAQQPVTDDSSDEHYKSVLCQASARAAAVLLLANSERYLRHACANTAALTSTHALSVLPSVAPQPRLDLELGKPGAIALAAIDALSWHQKQQYGLAMYAWWLMHAAGAGHACACGRRRAAGAREAGAALLPEPMLAWGDSARLAAGLGATAHLLCVGASQPCSARSPFAHRMFQLSAARCDQAFSTSKLVQSCVA